MGKALAVRIRVRGEECGCKPQGSQAGVGSTIAVGLGNALDDAVQTEAAQVVRHFAEVRLGVR